MFMSHIDLIVVLNDFKLGKSPRGQEPGPLWDPSSSCCVPSFWNRWICGSVSPVTVHGLFIPNANSREREFYWLSLDQVNPLSQPTTVRMGRGPSGHGDTALQVHLCVSRGQSWGRRKLMSHAAPIPTEKPWHKGPNRQKSS